MSRGQRAWLGPIPAINLACFEKLLLASLLLYITAWLQFAAEWLTTAGYHFSAASTPLGYPAPLTPLPEPWLPAFVVLLVGSMLASLIGWRRRTALWSAWLCLVYVTYVDRVSAYTINYLGVASLLVLALTRLPAVTRAQGCSISAWPMRTLQATMIIHYCTAGWCKLTHGDWLANPDVLHGHAIGIYRNEVSAWMNKSLPPVAWSVLQYQALAFELLVPVLFLVPKLRRLGLLWGVTFQLGIAITMHKVVYFNLAMLAFFVLFVPPGRLDALVRIGSPRCWRRGRQ